MYLLEHCTYTLYWAAMRQSCCIRSKFNLLFLTDDARYRHIAGTRSEFDYF